MEFKDEQVIYSSEKCKITKGEYNGKQCIKKMGSFSREAVNAIARINSPYIPHIHEIGDYYIISEYVDGADLTNVKISPRNVLGIALELCDALEALHKNSIIHRDVKPSNIILGSDGHIKLIDFDAARIKKATVDKDTVFIGTDGFAPPEQFGFTQTDERSDIYAFGVTIKLMLGENYARSSYKSVIEKCIRFNPEQRYMSIKSVRAALLRSRAMPIFGSAFAGVSLIAIIVAVFDSVLTSDKLSGAYTFSDSFRGISLYTNSLSEETRDVSEKSTSAISSFESVTESIPESNSPSIPENDQQSELESTPQSESDFPMEDERFYSVSWDILSLPEDFPRLHDKVTNFYFTNGYPEDMARAFNMSWNVMTKEETYEIVQKLHDWMGIKSDYYTIPGGDYLTEWIIRNENYDVHVAWGLEAFSNTWVSVMPKSEDKFPNLNLIHSDPTVTNYGIRQVKWEEVDTLGYLPKLTDMVTNMECSDGAYKIKWDYMKFEELESVIQKITDSFEGEYIFTVKLYSSAYIWEFDGNLNGVGRNIVVFYTTKYNSEHGKWPQVNIEVK